MGTRITEVDSYLENCEEKRRESLAALRDLIHAAQPDIVETYAWNMPTFNYNEENICSFASRKQYISLYCNTEVVDEHREALTKLSVGKGCIRFRKFADLPADTIRQIIVESCQRV